MNSSRKGGEETANKTETGAVKMPRTETRTKGRKG